MAKEKKGKEEVEEKVEAVSEATEEKKGKEEKGFPKVDGNGRFQAVPCKDGFVVFNPVGQRATGIIAEVRAKDLVMRSNRAIGIKG